MTPGFRAGVEVAAQQGLVANDPVLIQETNNTVVWLRPHPIIAKIGAHRDGAELLDREHEVASALTALGARWIDFEGACRGRLEWDLVFLSDDAGCGPAFAVMRCHAEHHLGVVRAGWPVQA